MEFEHTVDAKGRFNWPTKLRERFGDKFHITKSIYDTCLVVYNEEGWNKLENTLSELPMEQEMPLRRYLMGCSCDAEPDKQGRIAISAKLRAFAGIETDIVVVDGGSKVEIWDAAQWNGYNDSITQGEIMKLAKKIKL